MAIWIGGLSLLAMLTAAAQQPPSGNRPPSEKTRAASDQLELRFYDVSFLRQRESGLISGWLGEATGGGGASSGLGRGGNAEVFGGMGGGMGGMGGMGGGGGAMGGGGMFQIPDQILPQLGGAGGGGMGGMAATTNTGAYINAGELIVDSRIGAVMQLIQSSVSQGSWDTSGGAATMMLVGEQLAVYQTAAAHEQIKKLLEELRGRLASQKSVEVHVRLVSVTHEEAERFSQPRDGAWDELASREQSAHLSVRCRDGQRASIAAGVRRSYVLKAVPVVGNPAEQAGRSIGYSPVVITPLVGVYGQILPQIIEERPENDSSTQQAEIDLGIVLANAPSEVGSAVYGTGETIDRLELQTAELETSVLAAEGQWILAGITAITDGTSNVTSGEVLPHMAVLVKWAQTDKRQAQR